MQQRGRIDRRAVVIGVSAAGLGAVAAVVGLGVAQAQDDGGTGGPQPGAAPADPAGPSVPAPPGTTAPVAGATRKPTPSKPAVTRNMRDPVRDVTAYGADPTGRKDSAPALRKALAAVASGGGTVAFPAGTFRIVATAGAPFLSLPARTVLRGAGAAGTILRLESDDQAGYREFARPVGSDVVLQDFTLRRQGAFPSVLLNLPGVSGFTISRVVVDGAYRAGGPNYCHGLQLAAHSGTASNITIEDSTFTRCTSCTLITNESTGIVRDLIVQRSRMQNIDVNAPKADVRNVRIRDCTVDAAGSEYFGIALAHVTDVVISGTTIRRAQKEAIHIEDACSRITITRCTIERAALGATDAFAYIQVINASSDIRVERCRIDARGAGSKTGPSLIAVQQGGQGLTGAGRTFAPPRNVSIEKNQLLTDGNAVRIGIYLERIKGATIAGNRIVGGGSVALGAFSGTPGSAVRMVQPTTATVSGNTFIGWRTALAGQGAAAGRIRFSRNTVTDCHRVIAAAGVRASGTTTRRVVTR